MSIKVTTIEYIEFVDDDFKPPATFYIRDAIGDYQFYHTRLRDEAQKACDSVYGKGKYKIAAAKMAKSTKDYTCTGTATRKK